jgi:hypothetical protein
LFDVDDVLFVALDLMARRNGAVLIDDDVAKSAALVDDAVAKDDGTGDLGAFLDLDATADDGILDGSFDDAAIGDEAIGDLAFSAIDGWRCIVRAGVNRPVSVEEGFVWLSIKKLEGILDVMGKAVESSGIAIEWDAMDLGRDEIVGGNTFKVFGNAPRGIDAVAVVDHLD